MSNRRRLELLLRSKLRSAGQQYEEAMRAYNASKNATSTGLPTGEEGKVRIVCRRYAEKRSVTLDEQSHPPCFEPDHPDCQGCVEDINDGRIETW
jgi:type II secretory pathway pseudopilin PulG